MHTVIHVPWFADNRKASILSFHHTDSRDQTPDIKLALLLAETSQQSQTYKSFNNHTWTLDLSHLYLVLQFLKLANYPKQHLRNVRSKKSFKFVVESTNA